MSHLFGHLAWQGPEYPNTVTVKDGIVNEHGHPRNPTEDGDGRSNLIIPQYQDVFGDVFGIGNTMTAITTVALAYEMRRKWRALSPTTRIHVVGLLTEHSIPEEIIKGYDCPDGEEAWVAMKMFLRAVSNAHGADVDNIDAIIECVRAMTYTQWRHKHKPMRLKVHCERKYTPLGRLIPVMDRERIAFMRDVEYIFTKVPDAEIQICHLSDGETVEAVRELRRKGFNIFGEISPHYTEYTVDDLFEDGQGGTGLNAHLFCVPAFKTNRDRRIVLDAMTSGEDCFSFGDDGACHNNDSTQPKGVKITSSGIVVGGQTQIPEAVVSYVIEKFAEARRLSYLNDFLGGHARKGYGLSSTVCPPRPVRFKRQDWVVPKNIEMDLGNGKTIHCVVAMGGQTRKYRVVREGA